MKLEQQVTSLELSKKLKKLGVEQNSVFYWNNTRCSSSNPDWKIGIDGYEDCRGAISAFNVAELGEMLPKIIFNKKKTSFQGELFIRYLAGDKEWLIGYECHCPVLAKKEERIVPNFLAKTEADARAKMLIYLIENNLINNK